MWRQAPANSLSRRSFPSPMGQYWRIRGGRLPTDIVLVILCIFFHTRTAVLSDFRNTQAPPMSEGKVTEGWDTSAVAAPLLCSGSTRSMPHFVFRTRNRHSKHRMMKVVLAVSPVQVSAPSKGDGERGCAFSQSHAILHAGFFLQLPVF